MRRRIKFSNGGILLARSFPAVRDRVQRGIAVHVILFVVREVVALANARHPIRIALVPFDRLTQSFLERNGRLPAEFLFHLCAIEGVAAVVSRPVFSVGERGSSLS